MVAQVQREERPFNPLEFAATVLEKAILVVI